jgi:hypothetical protein
MRLELGMIRDPSFGNLCCWIPEVLRRQRFRRVMFVQMFSRFDYEWSRRRSGVGSKCDTRDFFLYDLGRVSGGIAHGVGIG